MSEDPSTPRAPDLSPDVVQSHMARTAQHSGYATKQWEKMLENSARQEGPMTFHSFSSAGPDPLKRIDSMLEHAVSGTDTSVAGIVKGVGSVMWEAINHPVAAFTDEYQVGKIRPLQEQFLRDHGETLRAMDDEMSQAKLNMRNLANLLYDTWFNPDKLKQIMRDKQYAGDHERLRIQDALDRTKDPEERKKLQAMKDDMDKWKTERDTRLQDEKPAVDAMRGKIDKLNDKLFEQRESLRDGGNSESPTTMTGPDGKGGTRVVATTHDRPDAVMHAASLHNLLLRARAGLGDALNP